MVEYIDREAVLEILDGLYEHHLTMHNAKIEDNLAKAGAEINYCQEALKALEKQIPKKPQNKKKANDGYAWQWICPNCHIVKITTEQNFCCDCGQALDWSDTE